MEDAIIAHFLELAASNNLFFFRKSAERNPSLVDRIGGWCVNRKASMQMFMEDRTPLMVAASYGSVDVMKLILTFKVDVNKSCGLDNVTALHCAASSGSKRAVEIAEMLLAAGADPNLKNANGHRPVDVIVVTSNSQGLKQSLESLLNPYMHFSTSPYSFNPVTALQSLPNYQGGASSSGLGKLDGNVNYVVEEPDISWVRNLLADNSYDVQDRLGYYCPSKAELPPSHPNYCLSESSNVMVDGATESFGLGTGLSGSYIDPLDPAVLKTLLDQMESLDYVNNIQEGSNRYAGSYC